MGLSSHCLMELLHSVMGRVKTTAAAHMDTVDLETLIVSVLGVWTIEVAKLRRSS